MYKSKYLCYSFLGKTLDLNNMKTKLIMTLLVRDEEDILEYNICHHLNQGVDHIIAIDNESIDQTPKILKKYELSDKNEEQLIKAIREILEFVFSCIDRVDGGLVDFFGSHVQIG